jgi:hypothetical protein
MPAAAAVVAIVLGQESQVSVQTTSCSQIRDPLSAKILPAQEETVQTLTKLAMQVGMD